MPMAMAKITIVVLVVVTIIAGTGNCICTYKFDVNTGDQPRFGTGGLIDFGLFQKDGVGWDHHTVNTSGHTESFTVVNNRCIDPCRLQLHFRQRVFGRHSWYCEGVSVTVAGEEVSHPKKEFKVERWFNIIFRTESIDNCSSSAGNYLLD